ncbi:epoxide hydrolase 1 [Parasteatoda tepidariorum]|uniref:epoxide hydrolase 1 n=1 Tax=Parasteatoda tepidariorum TaxID=114398 RepID=UPI001C7273BF|nr:epoxide hydrolase 1 [Parasteatoda tepidariorum]
MCFIILSASIALAVFVIKYISKYFSKKSWKEDLGYDKGWFGKEEPLLDDSEDEAIHSFKINVSDDVLNDLKRRLENPRYETPVKDSNFRYGFNPDYMKEVVEYWKTQYDWRKQEKELNKFSHFKTRIEGLDIHFMHIKPNLPEGSKIKIVPLMIIHGWPGCFMEFMKVSPLLTTPRPGCPFVFEVICPSIPGFGFSESPHRKGLNARAAARIFISLMERIGYSKFYVQGGDWGSCIASLMARYYPERIIGLHVNMYLFNMLSLEKLNFVLLFVFPFLMSREEYKLLFPLKKTLRFFLGETGYFHMNATKPDTLGCGMSDSPIGAAAYLLEKFSVATNAENLDLPDGGLTQKFSLDELLTLVMIYWVNNNFTSAARFYKENVPEMFKVIHEKVPVTVPSAVAHFPNEGLMLPKLLMSQQMKNLLFYTHMPKGGHFAAMEEPEIFAKDVWRFVEAVEKS